jgi:hypothetical protein
MAVNLSIKGVTYRYPTSNNEQWGTDATDWAIAVTEALGTVSVEGDIAPPTASQASILNNQSTVANVTDLSFDSASVRSAVIHYYIFRKHGATEVMESGVITLRYVNSAWTFTQEYQGDDTGVTLSITSSGQIQYISDNKTGTPYTGVMKYRAFALPRES